MYFLINLDKERIFKRIVRFNYFNIGYNIFLNEYNCK